MHKQHDTPEEGACRRGLYPPIEPYTHGRCVVSLPLPAPPC